MFQASLQMGGKKLHSMIKLLGALDKGKVSCQKTSGCTEQQQMEHMPVEHPLDLRILSGTHTVLGAQGRVWPDARHQAITFYPQASSPMKEEFSILLLNSKHYNRPHSSYLLTQTHPQQNHLE